MTRLLLCIACGIHVILTVQCTEHTPDGPNRTSSASSISNSVGTMDHYVVSANNIHQEFTAPRNERENYTNTQKTNDNHEVFARQSNDQQEGDLDTKNELKKNKSHDQAISNRGIDAGFVLQGKSKPVNDGTRLNSLENIQKNSVEKLNELENKTRNENTNNRTIGIYKDIVTNASYRNSMASDEIKYFRKGKDVFSNVTKLPNNEGSMIDNFRKHLDGVRKLTTEEINSTKDLHLDTSFSKESTEISTNITYLQFTFDNSVHTNLVENISVQSNSSHTTKNSNFQGETAQEKNLEHDVDDSKLKNNTNITNTLNNFIENITEAISTKESFRNVVENISKLANNSLTINQTDLIVGQAKKQYIDLDLKRFSYDNQKIGLLYPEEILYKQNETVQNFTSSRTINPKTTSTFYHKLHSSQNLENQSSPQKNKLTNIFLKHIANLTNRNNSTNITSEQFKQARNARPRKTFNALSTPKFPRKPERSARENSSELSEITEALFKNIPGKTLNQNTTELTLNPKQKLEAPGQYELPQRDAYLKEESLDDVSTGLLIKRLKPGVIKRNHLSPAPVYQTGDVEAVHGYRQPAAVRNISAEKTTTSKDHLPEDERPIQLEAIDLDEDKQISGTSTGSSQTTVTAHALTADKSMSALNHDELSLSPVGAGSIAVTIPNNTTRHSSTLGQLEIDDFPLKNIMTIPQNDRNETNSQNFAMGKIKEICVNCNRNSSGSNTRILMNITKHLATIFEYENYTLPLLPEIIQRIETTPRNMLATSFDFDLFNSTLEYGNDTYANDTLKIIQEFPWPVKREAVVEGDIVLGGLMMVHEREERITCGPVMPQGGIQALEAMLFTLDKVNESNLLPNITIGAHILDDCDKDTYGLEMAVDFIKGMIDNKKYCLK